METNMIKLLDILNEAKIVPKSPHLNLKNIFFLDKDGYWDIDKKFLANYVFFNKEKIKNVWNTLYKNSSLADLTDWDSAKITQEDIQTAIDRFHLEDMVDSRVFKDYFTAQDPVQKFLDSWDDEKEKKIIIAFLIALWKIK